MKNDFFLPLNSISIKKKISSIDYNFERIPQYIYNRILANKEQFLPIVNLLNQLQISGEMWYDFLYNLIPKQKQQFIKNNFKENKEIDNELINNIMKYFKIDKVSAKLYLEKLNKEEIKEIKKFFKQK